MKKLILVSALSAAAIMSSAQELGEDGTPLEPVESDYPGVSLSIRGGASHHTQIPQSHKNGGCGEVELNIPLGESAFDFNMRGFYAACSDDIGHSNPYQGGGSMTLNLVFFRDEILSPYIGIGCEWDGRQRRVHHQGVKKDTYQTWVRGRYVRTGWYSYRYTPGHYKTYTVKHRYDYYSTDSEHDDCFVGRIGLDLDVDWFHAKAELSYLPEQYDVDDLLVWRGVLGFDLCDNVRFDVAGSYEDKTHERSLMAGFTFTFGKGASGGTGARDPEPENLSLQERYVRWQGKRAPVEVIKSKIPVPPVAAVIDTLAVIPGAIYVPCATASDKAFARNVGREIYMAAIQDVQAGKSLDEIFNDRPEDRKAFTDYAHYVMGVDYEAEEKKDAEDEQKLNEAQAKIAEARKMDIKGMVSEFIGPRPSFTDLEAMKAYKEKVSALASVPKTFGSELGDIGSQITDTLRALNFKRLLNKQDREAQKYLQNLEAENQAPQETADK